MASYLEGSAVIYGALPAIAGLTEGNDANRTAFHNLPNVCPTIVKVVYDELETPLISQFGCTAVRVLATDHPRNKAKLGAMCSYIADVLVAYQSNLVIATEALHTVATLAHKSITNRNRLGSSDACSAVMLPINGFFEEHINATFVKVDKSLLFWTVRAIADLAANNPNNQAKLGHHGACDLLVKILRQRKPVAAEAQHEAKLMAVVFWAIGNLLQFGAKGVSLDQVATTAEAGITPKNIGRQLANLGGNKAVKNTTRFLDAGLPALMPNIMRAYLAYPVTMLWACRAVNNLAKSNRLKTALLDANMLGTVQGILEKYRDRADVTEWAMMARDVLTATNDA
jgi:hypothetical protein